MSDQGIEIRSWQALEAMDAALGHFVTRAGNLADYALQCVRDKADELDRDCAEQQDAVDAAQSAYDSCDSEEEDCSGYYDELRDAEATLADLERRRRHVRAALERAERSRRSFDRLLTDSGPSAQKSLREKLELLREYRAVTLEDASPAGKMPPGSLRAALVSQGVGSPTVAAIAAGIQNPLTALAPPDFYRCALPRGFVWLPLHRIDLQDTLKRLQGEEAWTKVSSVQMREGLQVFQSRILPLMMADPKNVNSQYFWNIDQQEGKDYEHGLQRIYDAFFAGTDHIYLTRGRGAPRFSITNGGHRLKLAKDMGWTMVPVKLKDLNGESSF